MKSTILPFVSLPVVCSVLFVFGSLVSLGLLLYFGLAPVSAPLLDEAVKVLVGIADELPLADTFIPGILK